MASFVTTSGLPVETYADGVGFMLTFANVTVFDTDAGLVLVDCGARTHAQFIYVMPTYPLLRSLFLFFPSSSLFRHSWGR